MIVVYHGKLRLILGQTDEKGVVARFMELDTTKHSIAQHSTANRIQPQRFKQSKGAKVEE